MKNLTAFLLITVLLFGACKNNSSGTDGADSTAGKEKHKDPLAAHDLKLYEQAMGRLDIVTAITSLNSYLMRDSSDLRYKDTLAQLYMNQQMIYPALRITEEILVKRPNDTAILKMNVVLAETGGVLDRAVNSTRKLLEIFKDNIEYKFYHGYALVHSMSTTAEGEKLLLEVAQSPEAAKIKAPFRTRNGGQIESNLQINAYMLLGEVQIQLGKFDEAEKYFTLATKGRRFDPAAEAILEVRQIKRNGGMGMMPPQ